jgi:hypothetical protein
MGDDQGRRWRADAEKIVAAVAAKYVCIVDQSKLVGVSATIRCRSR